MTKHSIIVMEFFRVIKPIVLWLNTYRLEALKFISRIYFSHRHQIGLLSSF